MPPDGRVLDLGANAMQPRGGAALTLLLRGGPRSGLSLTTAVRADGSNIDTLDHQGYTYRDSGHCSSHGIPIFDWLPDTRLRAR